MLKEPEDKEQSDVCTKVTEASYLTKIVARLRKRSRYRTMLVRSYRDYAVAEALDTVAEEIEGAIKDIAELREVSTPKDDKYSHGQPAHGWQYSCKRCVADENTNFVKSQAFEIAQLTDSIKRIHSVHQSIDRGYGVYICNACCTDSTGFQAKECYASHVHSSVQPICATIAALENE